MIHLIFLSVIGSTVLSGQTDTSNKITNTGYGQVTIRRTLIQEVIKKNSNGLSVDTVKYVCGSANLGGSVRVPIYQSKIFYRYKNLGITFITSSTSGDTISGIIFYPPFIGQTDKGVTVGQTKISSLDFLGKDSKISYSRPDRMGLHGDKKFSENANRYIKVDGIYYGYKKSPFTKNKFKVSHKTITEIRIGT